MDSAELLSLPPALLFRRRAEQLLAEAAVAEPTTAPALLRLAGALLVEAERRARPASGARPAE